jgi:radical SAM superfamily enzyme YgiQ (UPF0313 family)
VVTETVILRASTPTTSLVERFLDAMGRDADVDLVVEGLVARLVPAFAERLARGGPDALRAVVLAPLFPKVFALLVQSHKLGRTFRCRRVAGCEEVVIEIRRRPGPAPGPER